MTSPKGKITADGDCRHEIRRRLFLGRKVMTNLDSVLKSRHIVLLTRVHIDKAMYGLPSGNIWLWELDCKEGRTPQNWYLRTVMLEKTPENPLDSKEIKPINLKGNQPWIHIGRTDAEAPIFWSSDVNSWLIGKVPDARKDWGQKEKRRIEDEMLGCHHQCNGHELGQTSGDGEGQGGLVCCRSWGGKELDTTGQLNNKVSLLKLQIAENPTSDWLKQNRKWFLLT